MTWLTDLVQGTSPAGGILSLAIVIAVGLIIGSAKSRGASLGVAGVLFAGLLLGHLGLHPPAELLHFTRDFGLVLFVFMIGLQVGPGFIDGLRRDGLVLNILSISGIALSILLTVLLARAFDLPRGLAPGLLSGATTNTPSLAAAQETLRSLGGPDPASPAKSAALAYAMTYPIGVLGPIALLIAMRSLFRIDIAAETDRLTPPRSSSLGSMAIEIRDPSFDGVTIRDILKRFGQGLLISRLLRGGSVSLPNLDDVVRTGDVVLAIGPVDSIDAFQHAAGVRSPLDLRNMSEHVVWRRVLVTRRAPIGKTLAQLNLRQRLGVTVTRVQRAGIELPAVGGLPLNFADALILVGEADRVEVAAKELGDSPRSIDQPRFIPVMLGVALGVILGSVPVVLPGLPSPVKLGLAGGPLLVAIAAARLGRLGPLMWYMPTSANTALREGGLALFLASVGLQAGPVFFDTLAHGGLKLLALGAVITLVPQAIVLLIGRFALKLNFVHLCGLAAGQHTQPAALAFAQGICKGDSPAVAYAAVYPLTLLLRVLSMQILVQALG
jgi:putative transport protein